MSGRSSLAIFDAGGSKIRGNVTSFQKGGIKRNHEPNADGTVDFYEEVVPMAVTIETSFISDVKLEAIQAFKNGVGVLTYQTNGVVYRCPSCSFAEMGEIGPEGKVSITFGGSPAERSK